MEKGRFGARARDICHFATSRLPATGFAGWTGYEIGQQNYAPAVVTALATGYFLYQESRLSRMRDRALMELTFSAGAFAGSMMEDIKFPKLPESGMPFYTSLDGTKQIKDFGELLTSVGSGPEVATVRILTILGHAEKRELSQEEVETLRRASALLNLLPEFKDILCKDGQGMTKKLESLVAQYENKYHQTQT